MATIFIPENKLEEQIKRDPSQYLWSHNRFKHSDLMPTSN